VPEKTISSEAREAARIRFMDIAHKVNPGLLEDLYHDVSFLHPGELREKSLDEYLEALRKWLEEYNLFEDWQLKHATDQIYTWLHHDGDHDWDVGWTHLSASYSPALQPPILDVAWDLTPLDKAEEDALAAWKGFRSEIKSYYRALRGKQKRKSNDPDRHIRWLVRRKILGQSNEFIASMDEENSLMSDDPDFLMVVETVRKGIKVAEALTGPFRSKQPRLEVWFDDPNDIHYVE